jgi:subtilisin family serine protease
MKHVRLLLVIAIFIVFLFALAVISYSNQDGRPVITTRADLPKHSYPIAMSVKDLFASDESIEILADSVRRDIQSDMTNYDIKDAKTLRDMLNGLVDIALIRHQDSIALSILPQIGELEEKPSSKALSGILIRCIVKAEQSESRADANIAERAFVDLLRNQIEQKDWEVVQQDVKAMKGRMEYLTPNFIRGLAENDYGSTVEKTGQISIDQALDFLHAQSMILRVLPYKNAIATVLGEIIDNNTVEKKEIWAEREVDLTDSTGLSSVVIGIWDSGVDPSVYPDQMCRRPSESFDGKDDDGNGYVDDVYGIAFDLKGNPDPNVLLPLAKNEKDRILSFQRSFKGLEDLLAAIDSKESVNLKQKIASLSPKEVTPFMEDAWHYVMYSHGTHLAGIVIAGNPAAKITISRVTFDYKNVPTPLFEEDAHKYAEDFQKTVDYFKSEGVRVACMSWGMQAIDFEQAYEQNGIGADQKERAAMAKRVFDILMDGMTKAMKSDPDILFLIAAGNNDNSVDFDTDMPGSINLPNVMTVGAVDYAGDETNFTAYGKSVDVYANGFMVPSKVPGGETLELSGTSMAGPQVGNLASKLLAVDPKLTTVEVVDLIMKGSSPKEGGTVPLINPRKSMELLRTKLGN